METTSSGCAKVTIELTGKRTVPAKEEREVIFKRVQDTVRSTKAQKNSQCSANFATLKIFTLIYRLHKASYPCSIQSKEAQHCCRSCMLLNHKDAITLATKNLTKKDQIQLDNSIGLVYGFSPLNPTGRYRLDLTDFYQRLVAIRCLQISNEEALWRRSGAGDTSQHGNYSGFRRNNCW